MLRSAALAAALAVVLCAEPTRAQETVVESPLPAQLRWQPEWRRSNAWDYTLVLGATAGYVTAVILPRPEEAPDWNRPILFDSWVRSELVGHTRGVRDFAALASDIVLVGSIAHVAADATLVAGLHHHAPDVAWQMVVMDSEAYSISLFLNGISKRVTGRARPYVGPCSKDKNYDSACNASDPYASFYSGHSAITATSAGLLCSEHSNLHLYGGNWDTFACVNGAVVTTLTATLRIIADRHYATDVLTGHLLGFSSGYFVPELLHFTSGTTAGETITGKPQGARLLGVLPGVPELGDGISLNAVGVF